MVVVYRYQRFILCHVLYRDHPEATQQMNDLIIAKVSAALKGHWANPDLVFNCYYWYFNYYVVTYILCI